VSERLNELRLKKVFPNVASVLFTSSRLIWLINDEGETRRGDETSGYKIVLKYPCSWPMDCVWVKEGSVATSSVAALPAALWEGERGTHCQLCPCPDMHILYNSYPRQRTPHCAFC
jgi:hypothetical protein